MGQEIQHGSPLGNSRFHWDPSASWRQASLGPGPRMEENPTPGEVVGLGKSVPSTASPHIPAWP